MNKIKHIITVILFCCFNSYSQNWIWSTQAGGTDMEFARVMCTDANDNVYVSGTFRLSPCYFNTDTLNVSGYEDYFLAKYDPSGNEIWIKNLGGPNPILPQGYEGINAITYDNYSNTIIVAGRYYQYFIVDADTVFTGFADGFVAKFDLNGNLLWAKRAFSGGPDMGNAVTTASDGTVYVQYSLSGQGFIDTVPCSAGGYFVKYNSNGNLLWTSKKFNYISGNSEAEIYKMTIKDNKLFGIGKCFVDSFTVDTVTVHANFTNGQYILGCFDTSANAIWVKPCAHLFSFGDCAIIVDAGKNSYISGSFSTPGIFEYDTLTGSQDYFLAKYDSTGKKIWVRQGFSTNGARGSDLEWSTDGNFYFFGSFSDSLTLGSFTISGNAVTDFFVAKYDTSGTCAAVRHLGLAAGYCVSAISTGGFYAYGTFQSTVTFDSNPSLVSYGSWDIYLARSSDITGIGGEERIVNNQLLIYANPNKGTCNITIPDEFKHDKNLILQIFDNTGKLLQQTKVEMQQEKIKVNLEEEAKGVYNVKLSNGKKSYSGKIVFE